MSKTSKKKNLNQSIGPCFPELFLTPNGRKFLRKLKNNLILELSEQKEERGSFKEQKEKELFQNHQIKILQSKILDCESKLQLSDYPIQEQKTFCLPGNGVQVTLNGSMVYLVMDGVCVCKHHLPNEYAIISANSPLGKALMGKQVGAVVEYKASNLTHVLSVERIDLPSEAKWLFKFDQKKEEIAV